MKLRTSAKDALEEVSAASRQVVQTSELAAVALVTTAAVAVVALVVGLYTLNRVIAHEQQHAR